MDMLKLLFQELQVRAHHSQDRQQTPWDTAKDHNLGTSGGIRAIVFQGETDNHLPLGTANCPE